MKLNYKKIKMYKEARSFLHVSISVKALLSLAYSRDWYLSDFYSSYRSSLIYYSMLQLNIYKNLYVLSDADNFKKLSLTIL